MSTGTQTDLDWAGIDIAENITSAIPAGAPNGTGAGTYLTDEEILGIGPPSPHSGFGGQARQGEGADGAQRDSSSPRPVGAPQNDKALKGTTGQSNSSSMPEWMRSLTSDPKLGPDVQQQAQQFWQEHQEFRAAFSSPEEARAIKGLFPGGVAEAQSLRQASAAVEQLDAAIYSGDARAQSAVVAELALANPAAFRSLFAEAAKILGGMGQSQQVTQGSTRGGNDSSGQFGSADPGRQQSSPVTNHQSPVTSLQAPFADAQGEPFETQGTPQFDASAYAAFERSTNDVVARDVRSAVSDTLTRVLPEGIGDGAARRIGDDIFDEIHRTMASDRTLSEQVGEILGARRFGTPEQQRVASLLAGRARQLVPGVARRVIGEWTTSVLGTARNKAARQAAASSRVDIAAPGGSLDSTPLRPMSAREVDYASMSDEEILSF